MNAVLFAGVVAFVSLIMLMTDPDSIIKAEPYTPDIANTPLLIEIKTPYGGKICSGSVIDYKTVVTASHCLRGATEVRVTQLKREFKGVTWRDMPGARDGVVERDVSYITTDKNLRKENHREVENREYDLRGWVFNKGSVKAVGCVVRDEVIKHQGHYHVRCPLGRGASGSGLWRYVDSGEWELVGVVSQYDKGIVSISDVE
jgi:hypothetical protein